MKKRFTQLMAAFALLFLFSAPVVGWGQVVSGTTYNTTSTETLPTGWSGSGTNAGGSSSGYYILLESSSHYIQTSNFTQNGFSSVVVKARKYGGPNAAQAKITVSWYDAVTSTETVLGTIDPSSTSLTNYTISSPTNPTGNTTGYIKIQCKGAISGKGSGISAVTITYTAGTSNPTYTLTDGSGTNGSISFAPASTVEEGTHVTLTPMPSEAYYFVENSWSFFNDDSDEVTEDIVFVEGEANTIVMPAYNLTVDATFAAKPTYAITCVSNNESWGVLSASSTSAYEGQTVTLSYLPETGYRLSSIAITKTEDGSATGITPVESSDGFTFEMPNYAVTATATFEAIPTYTITFNAGTGTCTMPTMSGYEGSAITLPTATPSAACDSRGWVFAGWAETSVDETTTAPVLLTSPYTITSDASLYAVYRDVVNGSANTDNVFSHGSYSNNSITWTVANIVSITQEKGSGSTAPSQSYVAAPRWYSGNEITITPSVDINSITVTATSDSYANALANSTYTNASASATGTTVTITPTDGSSEDITIVMGGQSRLSSLVVNYSTSTTYYNTTPDCVMQYELTLPGNAEVLLFDGNENWIDVEDGTALIEGGTEVRVSIDHVADCQLFESLSINPESGTVTVDEIGTGYYSFIMPSCNASIVVSTTPATHYTLNIVKPSQVSFDGLLVGWDSDVITEFPASICEQASVLIDGLSISTGYFLKSATLTYGEETVELNKENGAYVFTMPAAIATLTFEVRDAASYTLVTSTEQLVSGKHYIIASGKNGNVKVMSSQTQNNNRTSIDANATSEGEIQETEGVYEFVINGPEIITKDDSQVEVYTIYDVNNLGYLYAASSSSNHLKNQKFNNANGQWTIEIDNGNAKATIKAQGDNSHNWMRNNGALFSCYLSGQNDIYLYVKDDTNYEFYKDIDNWTTSGEAVGGWYFIASPIDGSLDPEVVGNLLTADNAGEHTYDLYRLNYPTWENYRNEAHSDFTIANGAGYLYANAAKTTLKFSGVSVKAYSTSNNIVALAKDGWNLIGNPFTFPVAVNKAFGEVNNGSVITNKDAGSVINPYQGIAVYGSQGDEVIFTKPTVNAAAPSNLNLVLAQTVTTRGGNAVETLDNAIVSFNEGSQLGKFYFGTQNANLYIPQGIEEYAIVNAEAQGEMPVNFRANEDGQYTLTVNPENVDMNYLHLIDNMTGMDVDLLQTPSYTFNATTRDYESRFRLVFAANNEDGASTGSTAFAFFSNGNWIINNAGEATLQVIDLTGRILSSETVNGSVSTTINAVPGVYMLRLINGENVNVQKIVVR